MRPWILLNHSRKRLGLACTVHIFSRIRLVGSTLTATPFEHEKNMYRTWNTHLDYTHNLKLISAL